MLARIVRYGYTIRLFNLGVALRFCPATTRGWLWRALFRRVPGNFVGPRGRGRKILIRRCGDEELFYEGRERILLGEGEAQAIRFCSC
jgi:hypothetical protein